MKATWAPIALRTSSIALAIVWLPVLPTTSITMRRHHSSRFYQVQAQVHLRLSQRLVSYRLRTLDPLLSTDSAKEKATTTTDAANLMKEAKADLMSSTFQIVSSCFHRVWFGRCCECRAWQRFMV